MRTLAIAVICLLAAPPAFAGDLIAGTNRYETDMRSWPTGLHAGYYMYDSQGEIEIHSGPIPGGPVECHGAGFWTEKEIDGNGICIFGAAPDRWTVAFEMEKGNAFDKQIKNTYRRRGAWKVVEGTGKYWGMTGEGTFVTGPVVGGKKTTEWEGEVEIPK